MNIFELREKMASLSTAINEDAAFIAEKAADPSIKMEDIEAKQAHMEELQKRFELLKNQADNEEARQKAELERKQKELSGDGKADTRMTAKAAFYRDAFSGVRGKSYEGLGALPAGTADLGTGEYLLPHSMSNELITEPFEENSLRQIEPVTQITGLEEPRLLFTIEDAELADVTDQETAKEIELAGDSVAYGRFKTKIKATIKDTVLHGTDTNLVAAVENGLRSGLAVKEKMRAFAPATGNGAYDAAHKHMSFYAETEGETEIKTVTGDDIISAIINAWADLPETFSTNAKCVMRKQDYYAAVRELANSSNDLWGKKPEDVIGIPVIFNDRAVKPIVGDFRYSKQNYDIGTIYDTDKDVNKGEYYFVITAWGDQQIKLKSAFRIAAVNP